jgi:recombination protein U
VNEGKKFEQDLKTSIGDSTRLFYMRLKDSAGAWQGTTDKTRFTSSNACDCILHFEGVLFLAELKSHKGKSIPFKCFRESQLKELDKLRFRTEEVAIAILNFRDVEETYIVYFADIIDFIEESKKNGTRKSIPLEWVSELGYIIPQKLKKVRYTYDVEATLMHVIRDLY